jgi:hypothetical protein
MNSYTIDNLSINCSLNDGTIYFRVVDTESFVTFDGKYEVADFFLLSSIEDTFALICNCLSREINHTCVFHVENGKMRITFDCKIGGYFNVHFDVFLRERIFTDSGVLSAMVAKLETRQNTQNAKMESFCNALAELQLLTEALSYAEIRLSLNSANPNHLKFAPVNTTTITSDCYESNFDMRKVCVFPNLKELNIFVQPHAEVELYWMKSKTVEKLSFKGINYSINLCEILNNFPNLTTLTVDLKCKPPTHAIAITQTKHKLETISLSYATPDILILEQYCSDNKIAFNKLYT